MHLLVGFEGGLTCSCTCTLPSDDQLYDGCFVKGRKEVEVVPPKLCSCVYINEDHESRFFHTWYLLFFFAGEHRLLLTRS